MPELQAELNRLANGGTYPVSEYLDSQGAANKWAGTVGVDLLGALNIKNGTVGLGLNLVCNQLAGTTDFEAPTALSKRTTP